MDSILRSRPGLAWSSLNLHCLVFLGLALAGLSDVRRGEPLFALAKTLFKVLQELLNR
jgi:hypothetical protein